MRAGGDGIVAGPRGSRRAAGAGPRPALLRPVRLDHGLRAGAPPAPVRPGPARREQAARGMGRGGRHRGARRFARGAAQGAAHRGRRAAHRTGRGGLPVDGLHHAGHGQHRLPGHRGGGPRRRGGCALPAPGGTGHGRGLAAGRMGLRAGVDAAGGAARARLSAVRLGHPPLPAPRRDAPRRGPAGGGQPPCAPDRGPAARRVAGIPDPGLPPARRRTAPGGRCRFERIRSGRRLPGAWLPGRRSPERRAVSAMRGVFHHLQPPVLPCAAVVPAIHDRHSRAPGGTPGPRAVRAAGRGHRRTVGSRHLPPAAGRGRPVPGRHPGGRGRPRPP